MCRNLCAALALVVASVAPAWSVVDHRGHKVDHRAGSVACLSCHNGTRARSVMTCDNRMCRIYAKHVVEVPYPLDGNRKYPPAKEIRARGLELDNGKISCFTCHDLRNHAPMNLVLPQTDDDLCGVCHTL